MKDNLEIAYFVRKTKKRVVRGGWGGAKIIYSVQRGKRNSGALCCEVNFSLRKKGTKTKAPRTRSIKDCEKKQRSYVNNCRLASKVLDITH